MAIAESSALSGISPTKMKELSSCCDDAMSCYEHGCCEYVLVEVVVGMAMVAVVVMAPWCISAKWKLPDMFSLYLHMYLH